MDKLVRFVTWTIVLALVVAGIARAFFVTPWTLPTAEKDGDDWLFVASVAPTLRGGDLVLLQSNGTPGFGDLVRCPDPDDATKFVVGRVAGLGGDSVDTRGRILTVNRTQYNGESACPFGKVAIKHPASHTDVQLSCDIVNMGSGWHYRGFVGGMPPASATHADVAPGSLYILSDDRDFHDDSRDFGGVPASGCRKIFFRLVSKDGWGDSDARLSYIR